MEKIPVRHITTTHKEPDLTGNLSIRKIHDLLAGKDMIQELHRHDFFYVLIVRTGSGKHDIDSTSYNIAGNVVFFMRPGQVHSLLLKAGSTGYLLQFRADLYTTRGNVPNQLLRRAGYNTHYQLNAGKMQNLLGILDHIFQEFKDKDERYREVIIASMDIFLIKLARQNERLPSGQASLYMQEQLEALLFLLEKNVFKHKQVTLYATRLNLSTYQLNALTKTMLGKTCSELINEHIILEAKRQLLATSNQVNQIADQLGYEDVSYFIRFFKKHTGRSPEAFRNNFA